MPNALPPTIRVECYAGYKADQEPRRFSLKDKTYQVLAILDRWYGEDSDYFKVRGDDGHVYILRRYRAEDRWVLEGYRQDDAFA